MDDGAATSSGPVSSQEHPSESEYTRVLLSVFPWRMILREGESEAEHVDGAMSELFIMFHMLTWYLRAGAYPIS